MSPIQWTVLLIGVAGLGIGSVFYGGQQEQRLAEEAVRNVAGDADTLWVVKRSWPGRRTFLWCGAVRRKDGLVAVTVRGGRLPFLQRVTEVAPAWVEHRTPNETRMLEACWRLAS